MATVRPVTLVQHPLFGPEPVVTTCSNCGKEVTTEISRHASACSYITCILSVFICIPCFWVPLICPWFQDTIHACPNCKDTMGIYSSIPCFWVPLICPWFQDTIHACPNCKDTMGIYSRFN